MFTMCAAYVFACCTAQAQQKPCTPAEQDQVGKEADSFRTWDALYKSYKQFKHCRNNAEAEEGYSESKARILADHWETLPRLAELIKIDSEFGTFVGLDSTMRMDDVTRIRENALHHCPAGLSVLCTKLRKDAESAIADDAAVKKHG